MMLKKIRYTGGHFFFWMFSPLYIVFTGVGPVWLVLMVNAVYVFLIPVLVLPLLVLTNDKNLMGKYRNGWFTNSIMIMLVTVTIYFTYTHLIEL